MSEMAISVDPEAINQYIAQKVIESALGERLVAVVDEALRSFVGYGNDPLKAAVKDQVYSHIRTYVVEDHGERIREAVRAYLTDEQIDQLVQGFVSSLIAKVDRY